MATSTVQVAQAIPEQSQSRACSESNQFRNLITIQDVKTVLNRALAYRAEVHNFSVHPYADGKLGFLGTHQRLRIEARTRNGLETLCYFVKAVPYDVPTQAEYVTAKGVFEKEISFYRELLPELCDGYVGDQWMPLCYMVKKDAIILEDLAIKGYTMRNKLFDKELVEAGLAAIARLHATSLIAETRLGMPLNKVYPRAFVEKAFERVGKTHKWFEAGVNAAVAVAKELGLDSSRIPEACESIYNAIEPSPTKTNVLSHGDLWGNNLMFSDEKPPKCLLIDFQLMRYCVLAHDVIGFLYLCTNRSFRETWEDDMLKYYYDTLCETLKSSEIFVKVPDWSEIVEGTEEQRLCALVTAVLYFPTVLMNEKLAAEIMNDPENYSEYVFRNRDNVVLTNMKKDPAYGQRIAEAVTELVELCLRQSVSER